LENPYKHISSRNLEILKGFDGEKYLIASDFSHRYKKKIDLKKVKSFLRSYDDKINLICLSGSGYTKNISLSRVFFNIYFSVLCFLYLMRFLKKGDILLCNSIPPEVLYACAYAVYKKEASLHLDVRDVWPDALYKSGFKHQIFKYYSDLVYKLVCKKKIRSLSYVANCFVPWIDKYNFGFIVRKFVPLGYDNGRWQNNSMPDDADIQEVDVSEIRLLYIGYLNYQFDLTPLIKAVNRNKKLKFLVIGDGEKYLYYKSIACDSVTFLGAVEPHLVAGYVMSYLPHYGVVPMIDGGMACLPNKVFDYLALGLPIIALNANELSHFLSTYGVGIGIKNDVVDIVDYISRFHDLYYLSYKHAVQSCRDEFSMQNMSSEILSMLKCH